MVYSCNFCSATFSTRGNRSRSQHKFHPDDVGLPVYNCSLCAFNSRKLSELEQRMQTCHSKFTNCCRSCFMGFNDAHLFAQHMNSLQSLPVIGPENQPKDATAETAFNGVLQTYEIANNTADRDLESFMLNQRSAIVTLIEQRLSQGPQKVQFAVKVQLLKLHQDENSTETEERIEIYANSLMTPIYVEGFTDELYWSMLEKMMAVLSTFASSGSGWVVEKIIKLDVKFARYRPIRGSSYLALPHKLANCRGLLNIRNHDGANCFNYCFVAAYHAHHGISLDRDDRNYHIDKTFPATYQQQNIHQPVGEFEMPMGFEQMKAFETLNDVAIDVFGYDKGQLYPLRVSSFESDFVMDLLFLYDADIYHYVLITDLEKVVCKVRDLKFRFDYRICRNCFWLCRDGLESYSIHTENCYLNAPAVIQMPSPDKNEYKFSNFSATWFVPLVIYFNFESFLLPVAGCDAATDQSSTRVIEKHKPCGFALAVVDHHSNVPYFHHVDSSEDCMGNFVRMLHSLARDIHERKKKFPFYNVNCRNLDKKSATHCWICEEPFDSELDPEESIDLDHCHFSGQFFGWAHEKCNRARRYVNFTPVVGHNIQNYDLHHICLALNDCESTTTIKVIPSTDERYISMTFVLIDDITTQEGRTQKIYGYLRFIDSYKMMNSSLEKLVEILPDTHFDIMKAMFPSNSESNAHLLKQKGYYPYSYVCDRTNFSEECLPPLSEWRNTLEGGKLAVSEKNLSHANQMWKLLGCKTLQDYHDALTP